MARISRDRGAILQVGTLLGALFVLLTLFFITQELDDDEDRLVRLTASTEGAMWRIAYLDESLSMSARMYAASGRDEYRERYDRQADALDQVLAELTKTLDDPRFEQMVRQIDVVNRDLVNLELRAFGLTEKGAPDAALSILHGESYQRLKQSYAQASSAALQRAQEVASERLSTEQSLMAWANLTGFSTLALLSLLTLRGVITAQRKLSAEHGQVLLSRDALAAEIAEHQRTEKELIRATGDLQASEVRHRLVLQSALEAVISMDAVGDIVEWNRQAERCFGWSRTEALGRSFCDTVIAPALRHIFCEGFQREPGSGDQRLLNRRIEMTAIRKDATELPAELSMTAVDLNGTPIYTAFIRDITERKTAEAELRQHRDHLQDLVDTRTQDLVAAKEAAEQASQTKSQFLANMSHEIRTPMNAIIGLSHLALKDELSPRQRDYLTKIHQSGSFLLTILNDILDFAKIEAGKLDLDIDEFALDGVLTSVTSLMGFRVREKGLALMVGISPDVPARLVGDSGRLRQVLLNLVSNAVKFTERGEVRIDIDLAGHDEQGVLLRTTVTDTGIGMTAAQAELLFQPFYQADASHTRKYGGTGLGLSICQRLVNLMHGQISADSIPGLGTKVSFTARLGLGRADTALDQRLPVPLRNLRVLVVDDNEACGAAVKGMLDTLGYETATVDSADGALRELAAARSRPFDIVFMDWNMPQVNGIEAARLIKLRDDIVRQPAIVMVTAYDQPEVREDAAAADVEGYLVKPVNASMLLDSLVQIFKPPRTDVDAASGQQLADLRILLVEDNHINQQIAVELLEDWGAQVQVAQQGAEALALLEQSDSAYFQTVLMDIQMPVMDGYEAVRRIRQQPRFDQLPVIAMTAHALVQERQRCLDAGMNDYIPKPIDPQKLLETVQRWASSANTTIRPRPIATTAAAPAPEPEAAPEAVSEAVPAPVPAVGSVVDMDRALKQFRGRLALLEKVVGQMLDGYSNAPADLQRLLSEGDHEQAQRVAHTLGGLYGYLGAPDLQDVALSLEVAVEAAEPTVSGLLEKLEHQHVLAMAELRQWLAAKPRSAA